MATSEEASFLGAGWAFPPQFDIATRSVQVARGITDIEQSLRILFSTLPGERIMLPEYGCDLQAYVFEPLNTTTETELEEAIREAISKFESRIDVDDIQIDDTNYLDGLIEIEIDYTVRLTNSRQNMTFPFYILEGTSISTNRP